MAVGLVSQSACANDFRKRAIQADEFEPEVNFDCLPLRQTELSRFLDVAGDLAWQ
jgi:hypothetical protein